MKMSPIEFTLTVSKPAFGYQKITLTWSYMFIFSDL